MSHCQFLAEVLPMKTIVSGILLVLFCFTFSALFGKDAAPVPPYVAAPLVSDLDGLSGNEIAAMYHLVKAAAVMDRLFFRQAWSGNPQALRAMENYSGTDKKWLSDFFLVNFGPLTVWTKTKASSAPRSNHWAPPFIPTTWAGRSSKISSRPIRKNGSNLNRPIRSSGAARPAFRPSLTTNITGIL